jgi:hypothetical protein
MMIPKNKRWVNKDYTNWVATLPCANCGLDDETTVAHHLKHRHAPHGGGGMGMKANDFFTMPLCFECHASAHSGDGSVLDFQADFIFKTLTTAFSRGILDMPIMRSKTEQREWRKRKLFGEDLDD